jgi:disulfide oxidoreductase YuzD
MIIKMICCGVGGGHNLDCRKIVKSSQTVLKQKHPSATFDVEYLELAEDYENQNHILLQVEIDGKQRQYVLQRDSDKKAARA